MLKRRALSSAQSIVRLPSCGVQGFHQFGRAIRNTLHGSASLSLEPLKVRCSGSCISNIRKVYLDGSVSLERIITGIEQAIDEYAEAMIPMVSSGDETD